MTTRTTKPARTYFFVQYTTDIGPINTAVALPEGADLGHAVYREACRRGLAHPDDSVNFRAEEIDEAEYKRLAGNGQFVKVKSTQVRGLNFDCRGQRFECWLARGEYEVGGVVLIRRGRDDNEMVQARQLFRHRPNDKPEVWYVGETVYQNELKK